MLQKLDLFILNILLRLQKTNIFVLNEIQYQCGQKNQIFI